MEPFICSYTCLIFFLKKKAHLHATTRFASSPVLTLFPWFKKKKGTHNIYSQKSHLEIDLRNRSKGKIFTLISCDRTVLKENSWIQTRLKKHNKKRPTLTSQKGSGHKLLQHFPRSSCPSFLLSENEVSLQMEARYLHSARRALLQLTAQSPKYA